MRRCSALAHSTIRRCGSKCDQVDGTIQERYEEVKPVEQQNICTCCDIVPRLDRDGIVISVLASREMGCEGFGLFAGVRKLFLSSRSKGGAMHVVGDLRAKSFALHRQIVISPASSFSSTSYSLSKDALSVISPLAFWTLVHIVPLEKEKKRAPLSSTDARRPITTPSSSKTCLCLVEQVFGSLQYR